MDTGTPPGVWAGVWGRARRVAGGDVRTDPGHDDCTALWDQVAVVGGASVDHAFSAGDPLHRARCGGIRSVGRYSHAAGASHLRGDWKMFSFPNEPFPGGAPL